MALQFLDHSNQLVLNLNDHSRENSEAPALLEGRGQNAALITSID
jgi:hypothetical protein